MSYTAKQLIEGSLRLIGQLAEGETVGYDTANDCLLAMNQMLSSWSTERLSVFSTQDQISTAGVLSATCTNVYVSGCCGIQDEILIAASQVDIGYQTQRGISVAIPR